jgi:hypothetical protein
MIGSTCPSLVAVLHSFAVTGPASCCQHDASQGQHPRGAPSPPHRPCLARDAGRLPLAQPHLRECPITASYQALPQSAARPSSRPCTAARGVRPGRPGRMDRHRRPAAGAPASDQRDAASVTKDEARAALRRFDGLGGLERWIAEPRHGPHSRARPPVVWRGGPCRGRVRRRGRRPLRAARAWPPVGAAFRPCSRPACRRATRRRRRPCGCCWGRRRRPSSGSPRPRKCWR